VILSGHDVRRYISNGGLSFSPALSDEQLQQNGVDLILRDIGEQDGYWLGVTRETVTMPNDLMAFVQIRSSWARRGLFLPPTVIDAGFSGEITLEIADLSGKAISCAVGKRFAHLIFAKLAGPADPYCGKYQGQTGITLAYEESGL
jgi:dCTP deaminase